MTGYFKGIVFRKNVAHKKMKQNFENPKLLLLLGSLDEQNLNKNPLILEEYHEEKKIVRNILKYQVKVVLVEKVVNRYIME